MPNQLLLVGEDQFFSSRELHDNYETVHVRSVDEALNLTGRFDFHGIVASEGSSLLTEIRAQGKHTPFLNLTHAKGMNDCCGGHMIPSASVHEKFSVLKSLLKRNHETDCC